MSSTAARRMYEDQLPSFMSVFDLDGISKNGQDGATSTGNAVVEELDTKPSLNTIPLLRAHTTPADASHKHHDSTSTQNSESAESSPTTTVSCTDSSSLSDPSPSSSPDSPVNLLPLSSLTKPSFSGLGLPSLASLNVADNTTTTNDRPMTSPAPRRPKNMKGLSITPPFSAMANPLTSEPASPVFIKPVIPGMKRKPSQLSLKTNTSDLATRGLEIPNSPSVVTVPKLSMPPILQRRALKHSTSSPHILTSIKSATFGPVGGMQIPTVLERNESGLSEFFRPSKIAAPPPVLKSPIAEEDDSPIRTQVANRAVFDFEDYHEVENGEDQKTPGYPDGPIAIYGDNVYLYLEPTAEEAAKFDVVINVAREVRNPFASGNESQSTTTDSKPTADDSPTPETAMTGASFSTAFEFFPEEDSPATPRATSFKQPEYIHIPWDHNTDIGGELAGLCDTIEKKTNEGKKVLIHCQQGASRSASLIIAYGMWQNPNLTVNDAYHAAQAKSRWISPNMRLMYCLQDFQKEVSKRKLTPNSGLKFKSGRSPTKHRMTLSVDAIDISPVQQPLTAPLPADENGASRSPERSPNRARGNSTPNRGEPVSPGPSSAPSSFSWSEKDDDDDPSKFGRFNLQSAPKPSQLQQQSGFASLDSMTVPDPPTRKAPTPMRLAPPPVSQPPPSPGFGSFSNPPLSPGFGSFQVPNFSNPLSPGFPRQKPAFPSFSKPPPSPGFGSHSSFSKPPPSPGFGSHRFGGQKGGGIGLLPLNLQAAPRRLEASEAGQPERKVRLMRSFDDRALMSPRAETITNNPFHESFNKFAGLQFVEVPPTPSEGLFSPRENMFPRDPCFPLGPAKLPEDPRSPPIQGEAPIVRSIDEVL